jgi:hypothetical protein
MRLNNVLYATKTEIVVFFVGKFKLLVRTFGSFSKEDLRMKIGEFDLREKDIEEQMATKKRELEDIENISAVEKELEKICSACRKKLDKASFELKKHIVRKWVEEININDDGSVNIKIKILTGEEADKKDGQVFYVSNNVLQNAEALNIGLKFEEVIRP